MPDDIREAWRRLEAAIAANAKPMLKRLKPPATEEDIAKAEAKLKRTLPAALRELYLVHGAAGNVFPSAEKRDMAYSLIPVKQLAMHYRPCTLEDYGVAAEEVDADDGVAREAWHADWIPFATNGGGDYQCVDLAPGEGGTVGQVIELQHEGVARRLRAPSLIGWVDIIADRLTEGIYFADDGGLAHNGEDGSGRVSADAIRQRDDLVLVKKTKSGVEYWAKVIQSPAAARDEPPMRDILQGDDGRYYLIFPLQGNRVVAANGAALGGFEKAYAKAVM